MCLMVAIVVWEVYQILVHQVMHQKAKIKQQHGMYAHKFNKLRFSDKNACYQQNTHTCDVTVFLYQMHTV